MTKAAKPVAIITGVSGGIGLATAALMAARGWIVVGTVRGRMQPAALRGHQVDLQVADMLNARDLERVVQKTWRTYGRIDALVCNAGYGLIGPIDTLEYAQMDEQLRVNTLAPAELIRHAAPLMRRQGSGVIVGVSSLVGRNGLAGYSLYSASKFGLEGLLESLAMELAVSKVRVKLVEPSSVNTGFWRGLQRGSGRKWVNGELGPRTEASLSGESDQGLSADKVAAGIVRAVEDRSGRLRYPLGQTAALALARRLLPERWFGRLLRRVVTGN
ncbi:MAG TPA: SDR family NAD(P)-dependent oxidoreductase [Candidatus Saccharimonadia bacterium]|nr:SDR family NAD(P)-dependent oxidoreductase [Candidatus Saccharimonadia bacterium]